MNAAPSKAPSPRSTGAAAPIHEDVENYSGPNLSSRFDAATDNAGAARTQELKFLIDNYRSIQWAQYQNWRKARGL